jgi:membrane fusion protein (multidrug efflux system)
LWPGAFTEVQFHIPSAPGTLRIASTALIFGTNGMRVAAVDASNKVALKPVVLGRNLGNNVEIESGLSLTDRLIDNPQESIEAGATVRIVGQDGKTPKLADAD